MHIAHPKCQSSPLRHIHRPPPIICKNIGCHPLLVGAAASNICVLGIATIASSLFAITACNNRRLADTRRIEAEVQRNGTLGQEKDSRTQFKPGAIYASLTTKSL